MITIKAHTQYFPVLRDFRDTVHPFFESDTFFLEGVFLCVAFSCSPIPYLRRGMSEQYPLTVFLESPRWARC